MRSKAIPICRADLSGNGVDQAIYFEKDGKKVFGYSGDWGKPLNDDHNFCVKGVVMADRNPNPYYYDIKKCSAVYQNQRY